MSVVINLQELKSKLHDKLIPSGWGLKLRSFTQSAEFDQVLEYLVEQSEKGKRFTPPLKYLFRAFEECPYDKLKVVIIGMDPYPQLGVADGIPFSCSLTGKEQPSLRHIFNAIESTYNLEDYSRDVDLKRWSNQGVLLLNAALTTEIGKSGTHLKAWESFTSHVLEVLNSFNSGLVFVFMGKDAQTYSGLIGDHHFKIMVSHPASAAYRGGVWDCGNLFKTIDTILSANYHYNMKW